MVNHQLFMVEIVMVYLYAPPNSHNYWFVLVIAYHYPSGKLTWSLKITTSYR